jgi:hypothetical protein
MSKQVQGPWSALDRYHELRNQASEEARNEASNLMAEFGDFWAERLWEFVEDSMKEAKARTTLVSEDLSAR